MDGGKLHNLKAVDNNSVVEPVMVIHGTFARNQRWWHPESDFCKTLDRLLESEQSSARCGQTASRGLFHLWDGKNSEKSRTLAAINLSQQIEYAITEFGVKKIHFVAHSHGGNVLLKAIYRLKSEHIGSIGRVILLGTPRFTYESLGKVQRRPIHYNSGKAVSALVKSMSVFSLFVLFQYFFMSTLIFSSFLGNFLLFLLLALTWIAWSVFISALPETYGETDDLIRVQTINSSADEAISLLKAVWSVRESAPEQARRIFKPSGSLFFLRRSLFFTREYALSLEIGLGRIVRNHYEKLMARGSAKPSGPWGAAPALKWTIKDIVICELAEELGHVFPTHLFSSRKIDERIWIEPICAGYRLLLGIGAILRAQRRHTFRYRDEEVIGIVWFIQRLNVVVDVILSKIALAALLILDHVFGSVAEYLNVWLRRVAFSRGVRAVAAAAFGDDYGIEKITGIMGDNQYRFTEESIILAPDLERDLGAKAKKLSEKLSFAYYNADPNDRADIGLLAGRISQIFGQEDDDSGLIHCQYYRDERIIKIIAGLIAH